MESAGCSVTLNPLNRRLKAEELASFIRATTILIAGTEPITAAVMDMAPNLRLIARVGIGLDNVDLRAARERSIAVTYTPDGPSPAVSELTIALMLGALRRVSLADRDIRSGVWRRFAGRRIETCTVGVIGVGRIGGRVIRHIRGGFPATRIMACDLNPTCEFADDARVSWASIEEVFAASDIVSLHLPRTRVTEGMVNASLLASMRDGAILINTARGELIDEAALEAALIAGRPAFAALDTFCDEPYAGPLTKLENCVFTAHQGSMTVDTRLRMEAEASDEAVRFVMGLPPLRPVPDSEYEI